MKIYLDNPNQNITQLMRRLGYHPDRRQKSGSLSFSKRLSGADYPKYHVYLNKNTNFLNLHLDIKKPSYGGSNAHSGEYDSDLVKTEVQRIKESLV